MSNKHIEIDFFMNKSENKMKLSKAIRSKMVEINVILLYNPFMRLKRF